MMNLQCGFSMSGSHNVENGNCFPFPFSFHQEGKIDIVEGNQTRSAKSTRLDAFVILDGTGKTFGNVTRY
jgi:hypothetical protein